ncbi:outer membrane protein assembly factor BamB family protein [Pseudooceanicola nanhaiensis]|uniref:outer membrane protein assembly factor BamB family protein n=1 Tax=Pseudooceanicola nanhaiensis TaxID=375761 RepID=UPI003513C3AE
MAEAGVFSRAPLGAHLRFGLRAGLVGSLILLAGCGENEVLLPGKREDPRAVLQTEGPDEAQAPNRAVPIRLPAPSVNAAWLQGPGTPATRNTHPALSAAPQLIWSAPIGAGDGRRQRITADPVVSGGRIYAMDSESQVTATSTGGQTLWSRSLVPARDGATDAVGGGLALGGGKLFATSGFGELTAMDAATGAILWQQKLDSVGNGAPTYMNGVVYLVGGDGTGWAVDAGNGRIRWQLASAPTINALVGGSAPAVTDTFVIFPYASGEITAAFREGGLRRWDNVVAGRRPGVARANVNAVSGDPVVVGDTVYAGTLSGRLAAIGLGNGEPAWTAGEGPLSPVTVIGGSVFLISDRNELVRLDAATGERIWGTELPFFTRARPRKQAEIFGHYGPVVAGGRVIVASNDGQLRFFDPTNGALVRSIEIPGGATSDPVVAGGTLYVVSADGKLLAYR